MGSLPKEYDWIHLDTGEWLKGELKYMRQDSVTIDSEQFDDLTIDFDDVTRLYTARKFTFVFTRRRLVTGIGRVTPEEVIVETGHGRVSYPRSDLLSIVSGSKNEWRLWSGDVSLNVSQRTGNTNQTDLTLLANLNRRGALARVLTSYRSSYSNVNGVDTINNQKANGQLNLFLYERLYIMPAVVEYYSDQFQNIDYRVTPAIGVGYEIVDNKKVTWSVQVAPAYQATRYISAVSSQPLTNDTAAIMFSTRWKIKLTSDIKFTGNYSVTTALPETANTNQHFLGQLKVDVSTYISLNISVIWDRVGRPVAQSNGIVPLKDDLTLSAGLGLKF